MIDGVEGLVDSTRARLTIGGVRDLSSSLSRQSLLVAAVCLLADVAAVLSAGPISQLRAVDWALLAAVAAVDAALSLPTRLSGWVAAAHAVVRFAACALSVGSPIAGHANNAGALIAGYRAGAWLRGWAAFAALTVLMLGVGGASLVAAGHDSEIVPVEIVKDALLPWLVGRYTTARRAYLAQLEQQAENQRRDARAAVDHAVAEERSAIARDLHDVISHHVSAIGVHAGAARLGMTTAAAHPDGIAGSLSAVETASRSAMLDLRRLLDLLHGETSDTNRQPGLDNLEDLLDGVRRAGLPIRLSTHGVARPLPGSLDIALYRITQEMLTNALRHGDGTTAEIELRYADTSVSVAARNGIPSTVARQAIDGHSTRDQRGGGRGLTGIRKRAALFDGTISYGPNAGERRWETTATFPLGGDR
jgi:signal transduction histidine kinase